MTWKICRSLNSDWWQYCYWTNQGETNPSLASYWGWDFKISLKGQAGFEWKSRIILGLNLAKLGISRWTWILANLMQPAKKPNALYFSLFEFARSGHYLVRKTGAVDISHELLKIILILTFSPRHVRIQHRIWAPIRPSSMWFEAWGHPWPRKQSWSFVPNGTSS